MGSLFLPRPSIVRACCVLVPRKICKGRSASPERRTLPDLGEKEDPGMEKSSYSDRQWVGLRPSRAVGCVNKGGDRETWLGHYPSLWPGDPEARDLSREAWRIEPGLGLPPKRVRQVLTLDLSWTPQNPSAVFSGRFWAPYEPGSSFQSLTHYWKLQDAYPCLCACTCVMRTL